MAHRSRTTFQSTPSARRATKLRYFCAGEYGISIHALREESDSRYREIIRSVFDFNPRPPRGERRAKAGTAFDTIEISIHALREESDFFTQNDDGMGKISIHALREESDAEDDAAEE